MDDSNYYYDFISKKTYYIDSSEKKKFALFSQRYGAVLAAGAILYVVSNNVLLAIGVAAVIAIILEGIFRYYVASLPQRKMKHAPVRKSYIEKLREQYTVGRLWFECGVGILLAVLVYINVRQSNYEGAIYGLNVFLIIAAICFSLFFTFLALTSKKEKKN